MRTTFEKALQIKGHLHQALKGSEELNELAAELTRYGLDEHWDREKILEELTDVEIMIKQVKLIFNFTSDELLHMKALKIAKLEMHLQDCEKNNK
jgi:hypothetical protein